MSATTRTTEDRRLGKKAVHTTGVRNPIILAAVVAVLLGLVELPFSAFMADDFIQLGVLEGVSPSTWIGPFNLYTISDGDPAHVEILKNAGAFPWFFGARFKMAFFRPLSSALLALDHALFGLRPLGYRVHGVIWFLILVVGLGFLLRRVLPRPLGTLALLIFTISGIHGNLFWTATRHIVIAAAIGMVGLFCHVRWRADGWRPGRLLSVAAFALSLAASEAAMGMIGYVVAYEWLGAPGSRRERLRAGAPVASVVFLYLLLYGLSGLGASGGSGYTNPLREPLSFLVDLPGRLSVILGTVLIGGHADLWVLLPYFRTRMALVGVVVVLLFGLLLSAVWTSTPTTERRTVRWLVAGSIGSAVPFAGTPIGSRCLVVPLVGASVAIALLLHRWWTALRQRPGVSNRVLGVACACLAVIHLGIGPLQRLSAPFLLRQLMFEHLVTAMNEADFGEGTIESRVVVILTAPDLVVGFHSFFYRTLYRLPMPGTWRVLSWAPYPHRFHRTAEDTLVLDISGGEILAPGFRSNDVVELQGMRTTVVTVDGIGPTKVEFRFDRSVDDPSLHLMAWKEGRLRHVQPPPVGQSLLLPSEPFRPFQ